MRRSVPRVLALLSLPGFLGAAEPMMDSSLLNSYRSAAPNLVQDGQFQEAIDREKGALRIAQGQFGDLHPALAPILDDLGALERIFGLYSDAEKDYRWALALRERAFGLSSTPVAVSLRNLAALEADLGRWEEAALLIQKAQAILAKDPGNRTDNAQCLLEWGVLARAAGDLKTSETRLRECQALKDGTLPAWTLQEELARTLMAEGKKTEALENGQLALKARLKAFPADSPEVGRSLQFCGDLERASGSGKERDHYEAAAKIRDRLVGPDLYSNLPYLSEAAETDQALGRSKEAETLTLRVLSLTEHYFGPAHPRTAFVRERLAAIEQDLKQEGKAREYLREAARILEKDFGTDHPATLRAAQALAGITGK